MCKSVDQRPSRRESVLERIHLKLAEREQTLEDAIADRQLYFRVSVIGACNLKCSFCHNEGAGLNGRLSVEDARLAIETAVRIGFTRVQFTGGEPLLHPQIASFVKMARAYIDDVGVTTNGTYLNEKLVDLLDAGLARVHISLQVEPLRLAGSDGKWGIPQWLLP